MTRDLEAAARVQRALLPAEETLVVSDVAWRYVPCQGLAIDFLNVFQLDEDHVSSSLLVVVMVCLHLAVTVEDS